MPPAGSNKRNGRVYTPVSYTHLDVYKRQPPLVIWNDYSWKTDKGTFNAATDEFKPNKGKKVDENYVESINNTVTNKIRFSDQILKTDYYRVVFGDSQ